MKIKLTIGLIFDFKLNSHRKHVLSATDWTSSWTKRKLRKLTNLLLKFFFLLYKRIPCLFFLWRGNYKLLLHPNYPSPILKMHKPIIPKKSSYFYSKFFVFMLMKYSILQVFDIFSCIIIKRDSNLNILCEPAHHYCSKTFLWLPYILQCIIVRLQSSHLPWIWGSKELLVCCKTTINCRIWVYNSL